MPKPREWFFIILYMVFPMLHSPWTVTIVDASSAQSEHIESFGLGKTATEQEVQSWNIDISPNGDGLPDGQGTVKQGAIVYAQQCAVCHGATGVEGPKNRLVGGQGSLGTKYPVKTVGSYWPYATTLYDYIYRAMPFTAPQSLKPDEVYSVVAWILFRNGIINETAVMNAQTLPLVTMPNREGFVPDSRPDIE